MNVQKKQTIMVFAKTHHKHEHKDLKIIKEETVPCVGGSRVVMHCERRSRHVDLVNQDSQTDLSGDVILTPLEKAPGTPPDSADGKKKKGSKNGVSSLVGIMGKGKPEKAMSIADGAAQARRRGSRSTAAAKGRGESGQP